MSLTKFSEEKIKTVSLTFKTKPIVLCHLILTSWCNYYCPYCNWYNSGRKNKYIGLETWKKIIDKLSPYTHSFCLYGMEPTLYPYIVDLVEYMANSGLRFSLSTNGSSSLELYEKLIKSGLRNINLSLDTLKGLGNKYIDLKSKNSMKLIKFLNQQKIKGIIGVVVTEKNLSEIVDILKIATGSNRLTCMTVSQSDEKNKTISGKLSVSNQVLEKLLETVWLNKSRFILENDYVYEQYELFKNTKWKCSKLEFEMIAVDYDGTFKCCFDYKGDSFGKVNVLDIKLPEDFDYLIKLRKSDVKSCTGCTWNCGFVVEGVKLGKIPIYEVI